MLRRDFLKTVAGIAAFAVGRSVVNPQQRTPSFSLGDACVFGMQNLHAFQFPEAKEDWGEISRVTLHLSETGEELLWFWTGDRMVLRGDTIRIDPGNIYVGKG